MKCFRLLFDQLAWIKHQFLSGIRDSRKARSLWGMKRGVGGVRNSIYRVDWPNSLGYYVEVLREFRKRFRRKRPALCKSGQWHFHQDNAPVLNSILFTDYLTKMGINTVPHHPYSPDLAPCDFCSFPKLRGCRYETIEEMKEAVTSHWHAHTRGLPLGFPEVGTVQQVHCRRRRLLQWGLEFHVCTINKSAHMKKVWKLI